MTQKKRKDLEPSWFEPSNDRTTPYTEEELDQFVKGFIYSNPIKWKELVKIFGEEQAWNSIKDGFRKMDERHISNIEADDSFKH